MKKFKTFIFCLMFVVVFTLVGCGNGGGKASVAGGTCRVWVGTESVDFYQSLLNSYAQRHELPFSFKVEGMDAGTAAATFLNDTDAGADLLTVPHDNLGKLLDGSGAIASVKSKDLIRQMEAQNSEAFLNVVFLTPGDGGNKAIFAVPYIYQSLVLYYDKRVATEEDVSSFENLLAKAKQLNRMAVAWTGTDGYNFSSFLLAEPKSEDAIEAFGEKGTLKLYQNGIQTKNDATGDDQVAIIKYAQRFVADLNGRNGIITSSDKYSAEIKNGKVIGFISGAWKFNEAVSAWKEENVGVAKLPSFTLTAADAYGRATAGMEFQSGSFVDCKCFVKKKTSPFADYLDDVLAEITNDDAQLGSLKACNNLPASQTVELSDDILDSIVKADGSKLSDAEKMLVKAQKEMGPYGIAQPFGYKSKYNTYYYSKGTDGRIANAIQKSAKTGKFFTDSEILAQLQVCTYIWCKGKDPDDLSALNAWLDTTSLKNKSHPSSLPQS